MKTAVLRQSERTRFEVHSIPLRGGRIQQRSHQQNQSLKWYMRANHPVEAKRWVEAIGRSIEYFRQREGAGAESDSSSSRRRRSIDSASAESVIRLGLGIVSSSTSTGLSSNGGQKSFLKKIGGNGKERERDQESVSIVASTSGASSHPHTPSEGSPSLMGVTVNVVGSVPKDIGIGDGQSDDDPEEEDEYEGELTDDAESPGEGGKPPHPNIELHGNALSAQLEITAKLVEKMPTPAVSTAQTSQTQIKTHEALTESLHTTQSLLATFLHMTREREEWFSRQLKEDRKRQRVWEESLAVVVREGEGLEKELRKRRGRGAIFFRSGQPEGADTLREKGREGKRRPSAVGMISTSGTAAYQPPEQKAEEPPIAAASAPTPTPTPTMRLARRGTVATLILPNSSTSATASASQVTSKATDDDEEPDTDEEDEFFDAIETGNLPNLVVHEGLTSPTTATAAVTTPRASMAEIRPPSYAEVNKIRGPADLRSLSVPGSQLVLSSISKGVSVEPYAGYTLLRDRLPINQDDRPSMSLWSVLKHNIGKDLTKISFPVSFNEPTSMLQRMAEDMEFSECRELSCSFPRYLEGKKKLTAMLYTNDRTS